MEGSGFQWRQLRLERRVACCGAGRGPSGKARPLISKGSLLAPSQVEKEGADSQSGCVQGHGDFLPESTATQVIFLGVTAFSAGRRNLIEEGDEGGTNHPGDVSVDRGEGGDEPGEATDDVRDDADLTVAAIT